MPSSARALALPTGFYFPFAAPHTTVWWRLSTSHVGVLIVTKDPFGGGGVGWGVGGGGGEAPAGDPARLDLCSPLFGRWGAQRSSVLLTTAVAPRSSDSMVGPPPPARSQAVTSSSNTVST